ncbi:MAG: methyltransferase [Candidatus Peribacteraceae bacterium]|nr:methyltransferase [Candidatus Peribacteraceae bacterium]
MTLFNVINRTDSYYKNVGNVKDGIDNELTISHVLKSENSFTKERKSFGIIIAEELDLPEKPRILEIGPGLGHIAADICNSLTNYHYTFLDISRDFINNLRKKFKGGKYSFIVGDFLKEKINEKFDLIVCNEVLADFPTIVNMSVEDHHVDKDDEDIYYDAVSLVKFYNIKIPENYHFNYGAVKFIEKAKELLKDNGKIFVSEHSSKTPKLIRVYGHSEFTIDFEVLKKVAEKNNLMIKRNSTITELMGINDNKAVLFYTQPELKVLYNFFKVKGITLEQKAYRAEEVIKLLKDHGVQFFGIDNYQKFLERHEKPLKKITDQFRYMILQTKYD